MIGKFRRIFLEYEKRIKKSCKRTVHVGILDSSSVCTEWLNNIVYSDNDLLNIDDYKKY